MKLKSFTVENYRSITKANKLAMGGLTVIVGPNNEGKSNILRALQTGLEVLVASRYLELGKLTGQALQLPARLFPETYNWTVDFPVALQDEQGKGYTKLLYEFELSQEDAAEFAKAVGSQLNSLLPIEVQFGSSSVELRVRKRGPSKALTVKIAKIARFIASKLDYDYIPAVRTADAARDVLSQMVQRALAPLAEQQEYRTALETMRGLEARFLDQLSTSVRSDIQRFLPNVKTVSLRPLTRARAVNEIRPCEIVIDDGNETRLQQKGDGIQSLAAIALLRRASAHSAGARHLVLAIEEPECHLHPKAIHELRMVLTQLSQEHQIVMSTHCPILVSRGTECSNVIVEAGRARASESLVEVRAALGVRAADNLHHAELVLVVEGAHDKKALLGLLPAFSPKLGVALKSGTLAIEPLDGVTKLPHKLARFRNESCDFHVWIDSDKEAKSSLQEARDSLLISPQEFHLATVQGMKESEFEDLVDPDILDAVLFAHLGVQGVPPKVVAKHKKNKWKVRTQHIARDMGKDLSDAEIGDMKQEIAEAVLARGKGAISTGRAVAFEAFVQVLESRM